MKTLEFNRSSTWTKGLILAGTAASTLALADASLAADPLPLEQRPCVEMLEAYYGVDPAKAEGLFHDNFIKQGVYTHWKTGELVTPTMDKAEFMEVISADREKMPEDQWDISAETVDLSEMLATVKVTSVQLVDVCQLGNIDGEWQIINVLWTSRQQGESILGQSTDD